ncbi:MAG TPA: SdrD B-like domain-containing protein, partial [Pirellulales bacterium]
MGFLSNVFDRARSARQILAVEPSPTTRRGFRRLHIEQMEERRVMSAAPITIGAVYFDPGTGFDETPNTFRVSFVGGAAGTELQTLTINTDKDNDGLGPADTFFDTAAGGLGVYGFHPFQQVDNGDGIIINSVSVADGGTLLTLNLSGFTAGKTLVFTIDVDEMGARNFANAVAEGAEFQFSDLTATFTAPHYYDATGNAEFFDEFDPAFAGSGLNLPNDDYSPITTEADPVLTAGAIFNLAQPPKPSSLSGFVFDDTNIDNQQESGELGIGGVSLTLQIWNGSAYVGMPTPRTTVTGANGAYKFDNLAPGQYRVVETQPSGYFSVGARAGNIGGVIDGVVTTSDIISDVVLDPDQNSVHNDFAEARPAQISGYVYSDLNDNGIKDPGEAGIPNATVYVLNSSLQVIGTAHTDSVGFYSFTNLFPGSYTLSEDQPAGYLDGKDAVGTASGILVPPDGMTNITLLSGTNGLNYNFGELLPGRITGMVHADRNGDCIWEQGEPLLANVTIQLLNSQGVVIQTTKTDANGEYEFDQLPPGTYTVHEVQPIGYFEGGNMLGTASGVVSDVDTLSSIVLTPGLQALHYNFCEVEPASISGMVHVDTNGNCTYDPGEQLLSGVTIQLLNSLGQVVGTT